MKKEMGLVFFRRNVYYASRRDADSDIFKAGCAPGTERDAMTGACVIVVNTLNEDWDKMYFKT